MSKLMGIDYGERRIGIALTDETRSFAMPHSVVETVSQEESLTKLVRLIRETEAAEIVLGRPIMMNGTAGTMAVRVEAFAERLREATGLTVRLWDERLTTCEVERVLLSADVSRRRRKEVRDKLAACTILQSYVESINSSPDGFPE
jgi:putative Holliday junction resolvase